MNEVVAVDIGGTHARFAIAEIANGRVAALQPPTRLRTAEHASFESAWEAFAGEIGRPLPAAASIAIAGPVDGEVLKLTNSHWVLRRDTIGARLGVTRHALINDFGAVAHAVAQLPDAHFRSLCGPDQPLPEDRVISIVGPGTGLGVAQLLRRGGRDEVIETEGGHIDFAPLDALEDRILSILRSRYRRVSVERIASGPGLANLYEALALIESRDSRYSDERALWHAAIASEDKLAVAALDRFCLALGSIAGDIALAQGAGALVIAGGLGLRLVDLLPRSGFRERFIAKGRFERRMSELPVKIITYPEPGLFGAAAAFATKCAA